MAKTAKMKDQEGNNLQSSRAFYKIIILGAISAVLAFLFAYFLKSFAATASTSLAFAFSIFGIAFLSVYFLNVFLIKSSLARNSVILIEVLALTAPLYNNFSLEILFAGILVFLILMWGDYSGKNEIENILSIKLRRAGSSVLPKAVFATALLVSAFYFAEAGKFDTQKFFISERFFEYSLSQAAPIIKKFVPEFEPDIKVRELMQVAALSNAQDNPDFKLLPNALQREFIEKAAEASEKELSDYLKVKINPAELVGKELYNVAVQKFFSLPQNIQGLAPAAYAALIFLLILSFSWFIRWLATLLALIIYKGLLTFGFISIIYEEKNKEIVVLK